MPLTYILLTILQFLVMCMALAICYRSVRISRVALETVESVRTIANVQNAVIRLMLDREEKRKDPEAGYR